MGRTSFLWFLALSSLWAAGILGQDQPPLASLTGKHKTAFQNAVIGPEKGREKANAEVQGWGALSRKAADELRKWVATGWPLPSKPSGGKGAAADGLREIDVPGLGKREYFLHLPAGYSPKKSWPLAISLHGAGGEGAGDFQWIWQKWTRQWTGFIASPSGQPAGAQWFPEQKPFLLAVLADVRRNFAIDDDRIVLQGFSNGGNGSWYYALHFPGLWAAVLTRGGGPPLAECFENLQHLPMAVVHGDKDSVIEVDHDRAAAARLKELGYPVVYKEMPGDHEPFLDQVNPELYTWLGKQKRVAWPKRVTYRVGLEDAPRAYWVEAPDVRNSTGATFTVEVKDANRIEIEASGPEQLVLWLCDDLVDLDHPVTVTWGGKTVHEGMIPRRGADTLAWLEATGDRAAGPVARLVVKP